MRALLALTVVAAVHGAHAQDRRTLCDRAREFLAVTNRMTAIVDADTIDDWRTKRVTPGCRVTASGFTSAGIRREAAAFYDRVRAAGWVRSPDPFDAPSEASLRFRMSNVDCLFNVYEGALLNTASEVHAMSAREPQPGETRYNVLAMCVPAAPAASRP